LQHQTPVTSVVDVTLPISRCDLQLTLAALAALTLMGLGFSNPSETESLNDSCTELVMNKQGDLLCGERRDRNISLHRAIAKAELVSSTSYLFQLLQRQL
jgi:hypothetical protein